jgi:hypothetical protein
VFVRISNPVRRFAAVLFFPVLAAAQSDFPPDVLHGSVRPPAVTATRTNEPIVLDGQLVEPAWQQAVRVSDFVQKEPQEGAPATERTEVMVLFDSANLYLGVLCFDSEPDGIRATEQRRDNELESDDIFEMVLDTLHDHRSSYLFRINPLGTLYDATIIGEGQSSNENWNERWETQTSITEEGWFAEIRIPFSAVRFVPTDPITWGINFHRTIKRKNEDVFWTAHNRNFDFDEVSRAGHLMGLADIQGYRMMVKPFATTGASRQRQDGQLVTDNLTDAGIEVAKVLLTPQLTLDLTVNPDFAQADVDEAQVNLSRFSLFFPERREFFQEGAGLFEFGTGGDFFGPELLVFHSRRIGLSEDREEIPIYGGAKLTGKQGPFDIGLLNMQTRRSEEDLAGQNFTVARFKANVLARSYVGGIFTRNTAGATGPAGKTAGIDAGFTFLQHLELESFLAWNDIPGIKGEQWAGQVEAEWDSDRINMSLSHVSIQENFLPQMGFVARAEEGWKGVQHSSVGGSYRPRPGVLGIRQLEISGFVDYFANQEGLLDTREYEVGWGADFESGEDFSVEYSRNFERLVEPLRFREGDEIVAAVAPGDYSWYDVRMMFETYEGRSFSFNLGMEVGEFYDGTATNIDLSAEFRASRNLSLEPSIEWNRISLPGYPTFTATEMNSEINYSFNQQWLTRTTFLLNSQDREYGVNFRLNYIYRPENDIFVVYNETRSYGDGGELQNRALIVKMTYSFDF